MEQVVENQVKRNLLGQLPEEDQATVEDRIFTDQEYFRELLLVEGELTDDFVFGTLSDDEHERMQKHFLLVPERFENLKITEAIERYVSEFSDDYSPESHWENILGEAHRNRNLLESLISGDWMGLKLLVILRGYSRSLEDLASSLKEPEYILAPILEQLVISGLADKVGDWFFSTQLGNESLTKIEESSCRLDSMI